jgi:hypothetical protein
MMGEYNGDGGDETGDPYQMRDLMNPDQPAGPVPQAPQQGMGDMGLPVQENGNGAAAAESQPGASQQFWGGVAQQAGEVISQVGDVYSQSQRREMLEKLSRPQKQRPGYRPTAPVGPMQQFERLSSGKVAFLVLVGVAVVGAGVWFAYKAGRKRRRR